MGLLFKEWIKTKRYAYLKRLQTRSKKTTPADFKDPSGTDTVLTVSENKKLVKTG
jgi:hypothetical protein